MHALAMRDTVVAAQLFAHQPQQIVARRLAEVAGADARGVA